MVVATVSSGNSGRFLPLRTSALATVRAGGLPLCDAGCGTSLGPNSCHPLSSPIDALQKCGNVEVYIESWPVQSCTIAENLNLRKLLSRRSLQPLKVFTREKAAMPVTHLQDQQIESWTGSISHTGYSWLIRQRFRARNRLIYLSIGGNDPMRCHDSSPRVPPTRQSVMPLRTISFSRLSVWHLADELHLHAPPMPRSRRAASLRLPQSHP